MSCRTRQFLPFFICLSLFSTAKGQSSVPDYSIVNYNSENGLPQNSVKYMAFDRNGFLWLATEMGMVRFDGRNFREYNTANSPAMHSDRCMLSFPQQSSGKLLIEPLIPNQRMLTITGDYQLREDSTLPFNPYECHAAGNHLFSFANLYNKWAARDTGVFGGLFIMLGSNMDL